MPDQCGFLSCGFTRRELTVRLLIERLCSASARVRFRNSPSGPCRVLAATVTVRDADQASRVLTLCECRWPEETRRAREALAAEMPRHGLGGYHP